jgi:hypothetical protein
VHPPYDICSVKFFDMSLNLALVHPNLSGSEHCFELDAARISSYYLPHAPVGFQSEAVPKLFAES